MPGMRRLLLLVPFLAPLAPFAPASAEPICQYVEVDGNEVANPCASYSGAVSCASAGQPTPVGHVFVVVCHPQIN